MFNHPDYDAHEVLLFTQDAASGLRALIAIHDTTLGPAFGGCRMYPYASEQHAMTDVLRLSRGMTYKAAFIADDTGLGKTIEAGLIARELLLRKKAKTIVVATPRSQVAGGEL